jgi:hypothetical protein
MQAGSNRKLIIMAAAFAAVYIFWGSTYLAIKYAIETLPPFTMAGMRFVFAGSVLFLIAWRSSDFEMPRAEHWKTSAIIGTLLLLGGNGGVDRGTAARKHLRARLGSQSLAGCDDAVGGDHHGPRLGAVLTVTGGHKEQRGTSDCGRKS